MPWSFLTQPLAFQQRNKNLPPFERLLNNDCPTFCFVDGSWRHQLSLSDVTVTQLRSFFAPFDVIADAPVSVLGSNPVRLYQEFARGSSWGIPDGGIPDGGIPNRSQQSVFVGGSRLLRRSRRFIATCLLRMSGACASLLRAMLNRDTTRACANVRRLFNDHTVSPGLWYDHAESMRPADPCLIIWNNYISIYLTININYVNNIY